MKTLKYEFLSRAARIFNSGQSNSIVLTGYVDDLFYLPGEVNNGLGAYVALPNLLADRWTIPGRIVIRYEFKGPLVFRRKEDIQTLEKAWTCWQRNLTPQELAERRRRNRDELSDGRYALEGLLDKVFERPTFAIDLLRQFCMCSRMTKNGKRLLNEDLVIIIENADMLIPDVPVDRLSDTDKHRVILCQNWFSDMEFMHSRDNVLLITESRSQLHRKVTQLPQIMEVEILAPDETKRKHFISWFTRKHKGDIKLACSQQQLAHESAPLSIHALRQMFLDAIETGKRFSVKDVTPKIEEYIKSQLGNMGEFVKPDHDPKDVVGCRRILKYFNEELIPRLRADHKSALPGAIACGPLGSGKTFVCSAVAGALGIPVLVLKNFRDMWYGGTDLKLDRIRRIIYALNRLIIFMDEADAVLGDLSKEEHSTERRSIGAIQEMMSDKKLLGKAFWFLMSARVWKIATDVRRPGRPGGLIIPFDDPEGDDKIDFIGWAIRPVYDGKIDEDVFTKFDKFTQGFSAGSFDDLRRELMFKSKLKKNKLTLDEIEAIIADILPSDIGKMRRYQTLQAYANCTRKSLLPNDAHNREQVLSEIRELEREGVLS